MNQFVKHENQLVNSCIANNRSAQEDLYKMYYAEMLRICCRYLKSDELAIEALNSGFLKVFQNIQSFDIKKGGLGGWIRTIMVRTCIDLGRKEAKFNGVSGSLEEIEALFISPAVLDKLFAEDLLNAIRQLPYSAQIVFNLSVIEGYSHMEIGQQLQIAESTSRWHLSEAKKQLRILIAPASKSFNKPTENQNKER